MSKKKVPEFAIDRSADGKTVWVTGSDGSNIGRFSKTFGMDVHTTVTEQMAGSGQCLHCTHGRPGPAEWELFREKILTHYGIEVPADFITWP